MQDFQYNHRSTQNIFCLLLIFQLILSGVIGYFTNTFVFGLGLGLLISGPTILVAIKSPNSVFARHMMAIATQLMAALHIQQTMGMTEMHFQVFVLTCIYFIFPRLESDHHKYSGNRCAPCCWFFAATCWGRARGF